MGERTYGFCMMWQGRRGDLTDVSVTGCANFNEAYRECMASAVRWGWTRPRWWQWWRWGDVDYAAPKYRRIMGDG